MSLNPSLTSEVDLLSSYRSNDASVALAKIRIVHLSDLHIVSHPFLKRIDKVQGVRGHDPDILPALQRETRLLKPDLLIVSGDQTTWGDKTSLQFARNFIQELAKEIQISQQQICWIPGNHDVLLDYYLGDRFSPRNHEIVFGETPSCRCLNVAGYHIGLFPFDSTLDPKKLHIALRPWVGSKGRVSSLSFNNFNESTNTPAVAQCSFKIAVVHHHPLPIPFKGGGQNVGIELTTMSNGGTFIAHMQESGINLVLHGHEHHSYSCRYSFDPDRPDIVIVAAGSASQRGAHENSFNYLEIVPDERIVVRKYLYTEAGFRRDAVKIFAIERS